MLFDKFSINIILLDCSDSCGRYIERLDFVIFDHPPAYPRIGCPRGLPLIHDGRAASEEWPIYNEVVPDDPADVGGGQHHIVSMNVEIVLEAVVVGGQLPTVTTVDALGRPCGATGIQNKPGVVSGDGHHLVPLVLGDIGHLFIIVEVVTSVDILLSVTSALDDDSLHLWQTRYLQSLVDVRDVRNDAIGLEATGSCNDEGGLRVAHSVGQLFWGKTTEYY